MENKDKYSKILYIPFPTNKITFIREDYKQMIK